ncbi:MAG: hypothetical protein HKN74_09720 [Acidimicrobiia bacterium]|nr:hypothetical protein [Acidimicrobiia bacterium]MBT8216258.1 hypothetical protein [Acidimicrobiia bacterium]NNF10550.1 hypothetical protein [Acidimicrobiia bacterium]NNL69805.1 hypothetical protein [Acidimicrobiia bacterium]
MAFDFPAAVDVRSDIGRLFRREWERLARPGTWFGGADRVAIATAARAARTPGAPPVNHELVEAAETVAARPATIRRRWVQSVTREIGFAPYVELVGVVSRLVAIDAFHVAIGAPLEPLPEPERGEPSRIEERAARPGAAWVPMVGGASITQALSLVDAEASAQEDMHGPLYLTYEEMAELDYVRGLSRAQMELVAARTSAINECFY